MIEVVIVVWFIVKEKYLLLKNKQNVTINVTVNVFDYKTYYLIHVE